MYPLESAAVTLGGGVIFVLFVCLFFYSICVYLCIFVYLLLYVCGYEYRCHDTSGIQRMVHGVSFLLPHLGGFRRSNSGHLPCATSAFFSLTQILTLKGRPFNTGKDERLGQSSAAASPAPPNDFVILLRPGQFCSRNNYS